MDISINKVRFGYWEYSAIYKNLCVRKLYDTNNVRINKKDFREYAKIYTQYN
jgi:hypothetical protein